MKQSTESLLKKDIGFVVAMSLVIGSVIGSGIFMKPGKVIAAAGDSSMALLAWGLGGIITLASGLTIAELSVQIPRTGGLYVYLEEVYGKLSGYLCGWVNTIIYGPAVIGALGLYFGYLMVNFFSLPAEWKLGVGIATVIFLAIINSLGTKYGGMIQTAATAGKLVPIALIAIFGITQGNGQILDMTSGLTNHTGMGAAILATLWAYDGWILVGFVAGEMKNPAKLLPRAIIIGLIVVVAAYLSVNIGILHVLAADQVVKLGPNAAGYASTILFGDFGGKILSIGILISIFGTLNGKIMAFPRMPYAMAERGQLPFSGVWSTVSKRFGTPVYATFIEVALAALLMLLGDPDRLSDIAVFVLYIFYLQAFIGVFLLRKRNPGLVRSYSVPGYPFIPLVAILGSIFILVTTIMDSPVDSLYAIGIMVAGLPMYWMLKR